MKLFIASDIHGDFDAASRLVAAYRESGAEKLVLLGDVLYHGPRNDLPRDYAPKEVIAMLNAMKDEILCVRGNCDADVDQLVLNFPILAESSFLATEDLTIFATHGHNYGPDKLPPMSAGDLLISGHIHIPVCREQDGVWLLNPGSVSIPKDGSHSCMVYENGEFRTCILEA